MKKNLLFLFVLTMLFIIVGCAPAEAPPANVTRYIDDEAGVVCWIYTTSNGGGISCLPLGQTRISR